MRTKYFWILIFLLSVSFVACKNQTKNNNEISNADQAQSDDYFYLFGKQDSLRKIDSLLETVNCNKFSLSFAKPDNEQYFASMYCDSTGIVRRMEEMIIDKNSLYKKNKFYFNKSGIFASTSEYQIKQDTNLIFIEEQNFYNTKGKIEKSFKKVSKDGAEGDFVASKDNQKINTDRIFKAVNNEGEFALTFQGIIRGENGNLDFLLVGSPEKDGFTSALQIEKRTKFLNDIYANERKYIGRKIGVNFQRMTTGNFSYQSFVAGKWLD